MLENKIQRLEKRLKALRSKPNTGSSGKEKVDVLNDFAYAIVKSDPKKTEVHAKKALIIAKKIRYQKGDARALQIIGVSHGIRGNYDQALRYFCQSLKIREDIGDKRLVANTYHTIGNVHWLRGDFEDALAYYINGLSMYEQIDDKDNIAISYNDIGSVYKDMKDFDTALEYHLKALKLHKFVDNKSSLADIYNNTGIIYVQRQEYKKALGYFQQARELRKEIGDKSGLAAAYRNIGVVFLKQNRFKQALKNFQQALIGHEELDEKDGVAGVCTGIGRAHIGLKHYNSARGFLQRALQIVQETGAKAQEMEIHELLSKFHEVQKNFKQAFDHYKKSTELEREIFNIEKSKQITDMRTKYETERKEQQAKIYHLRNVELRKEIKQRKKVEKEMKQHRFVLEKLVEERTAQLRSLAHELSLVEEKQRRRIATYLHDDISQALALATIRLELLQEEVPENDIKQRIEEIKDMIDRTTLRTRSLTFEISPPVLYDSGLEPAVEWLAEQFQSQHDIVCELKNDGLPKPMSGDTKVILFQSVRELLTNVAKHAQARAVRVLTLRDGNTIRIEVKDDGIGFNPEILAQKITKNEGFGLFNLKERLRHLGGKLEVSSRVGQGTAVVIMAPLKSPRRGVDKKQRRA